MYEKVTAGVPRIDRVFEKCRKEGRTALIAYFCAGYPDMRYSEDIINSALDSGADIVEVGMPFSDPLADGPIIQSASQQSLAAGTRLEGVFEMCARIREKYDNPMLIMSYFNPILTFGIERFLEKSIESGVDGAIVPDLPVEEAGLFSSLAGDKGLASVLFAAPTSTDDRLEEISAKASGFIYCVSRTGTTGKRLDTRDQAKELSLRLRKVTSKPLSVGFGVSSPEDVADFSPYFDGVIVGSALVRVIERYRGERRECLERVGEFVSMLKKACSRKSGSGVY